jgi:UDP-3-O-[3-hydroxymyristoyl] N-acetylglucosamine deacetylase
MATTFANTDLSIFQHTLADSVTCMGRGLHSGLKVMMTIMPAEPNTGIEFVRRDVVQGQSVKARWHAVSNTELSTTITNEMGVRVSTTEHLMAALYAYGIDNARIVLDAPELPIMDGSAAPFIQLLQSVGKRSQKEERLVITIDKAIGVNENRASAAFVPSFVPWIDMTIDFAERPIGRQKLSLPFGRDTFVEQVAEARTFGFEKHLQELKRRGLARGSSLKNAILIADDKVVNCDGLRYADEFVRHKYLDAVGDLALAGHYIIGHFIGHKSGHRLNNLLLREMFASNSWSLRPISEAHQAWLNFESESEHSAISISA